MKKEELLEKIEENGYPPTLYSIDGGMVNGIMLQTRGERRFRVFYLDEKGGERREKVFENEEEAYDYMYELILPDIRLLSEEIKNKYKMLYKSKK